MRFEMETSVVFWFIEEMHLRNLEHLISDFYALIKNIFVFRFGHICESMMSFLAVDSWISQSKFGLYVFVLALYLTCNIDESQFTMSRLVIFGAAFAFAKFMHDAEIIIEQVPWLRSSCICRSL